MSMYSGIINRRSEIDEIKRLIISDKSYPFIGKFLIRFSNSKDTLRKLNQIKPMSYLGVKDNRCIFLGLISYDPIEKIRTASFYFDTIHLKREFKLIYDKEIENQRKITGKLPKEFREFLEVKE